MLQIKGFPGREWATIGELAERLASNKASRGRVAGLEMRGCGAGQAKHQSHRPPSGRVQLTGKGKSMPGAGWRACIGSELLSLQGTFTVPDLTALGRDQATIRSPQRGGGLAR